MNKIGLHVCIQKSSPFSSLILIGSMSRFPPLSHHPLFSLSVISFPRLLKVPYWEESSSNKVLGCTPGELIMSGELTARCFLPSVYLLDSLPLIWEAGVNTGRGGKTSLSSWNWCRNACMHSLTSDICCGDNSFYNKLFVTHRVQWVKQMSAFS